MRWYLTGVSVVWIVVAGCAPDDGRPTPLRRLADEEARRRGASEPPTVQIGDTTRYVFGAAPPAWQSRSPTPDAQGRSRLEVVCPPRLAGRRVMVEVMTLAGTTAEDAEVTTAALRRSCPPDPELPLAVYMAGGAPGATVLGHAVRVSDLPARLVTTAPLVIPPQGELRLDVGVLGEMGGNWPLRIAVRAVGPTGTRILLRRTVVPPDERWHALRVPVERAREALGREVRLEFKTEVARDAERVARLALGNPVVWGRTRPAAGQPERNVVLISLDTLRADRLGAYGFPLPVSPVLDGVAGEGTLFEHAIAQASWTIPSHATMLTGTYSCVHGLGIDEYERNPEDARRTHPLLGRPLPVGVRPLAELLRGAAYSTAAFTENAFVDPGSFQRGFDEFSTDKRIGWAAGVVEETVGSAVAWLRAHADERFFLFVHTYQVHDPFTPPPAFDHLASLRPLPVAPGGLPPAPDLETDAANYVAEVAYTDVSLAPLFRTLGELGLTDRTIVIVTSDHGEAFGEQGARGHALTISEQELHVPLIWRAPGLIAPGRRVPTMVGVVDIAPTVLALLGLEVPPWMQGRSLAPLLALEPPGGAAVEPPRVLPVEALKIQGVRGADWKVARRGATFAVVSVSPAGVETPVARPSPGQLEPAFATVARECDRARGLLDMKGLRRPAPTNVWVDPERERKLRALGYLD